MKKSKNQLINLFNRIFNKHNQDNRIKKSHNTHNMENLVGTEYPFVIPGRWVSKDQNINGDKFEGEFIDIIHEDPKKPGYFLFSVVGDGNHNKMGGGSNIKSKSESYILSEYLYYGDAVGIEKKVKSIDLSNLPDLDVSSNVNKTPKQLKTNGVEHSISPKIIPQIPQQEIHTTQQVNESIQHIQQTQTFNHQLIEKLINKHGSGSEYFANNLTLITKINFTDMINSLKLLDIDEKEIVDYMFTNPAFINEIKKGFLKAFEDPNSGGLTVEESIQPITTETDNEPIEDDDVITNNDLMDALYDIQERLQLINGYSQKASNTSTMVYTEIEGLDRKLANHKDQIISAIESIDIDLEPAYNDTALDIDFPEEQIIKVTEEQFNEPEPEIFVEPVKDKVNYADMVKRFKSNQ